MFSFLSAKKTICTAWRMSGAVIQLRLTAEPDLVTISYIQTDVTTNHRLHPKEFKQKYLAHKTNIKPYLTIGVLCLLGKLFDPFIYFGV